MNPLDLMNGAFEAVAAVLTWGNVLRIRRDREVKGIDWRVQAFWGAWGISNIYYYHTLQHWFSLAGGCVLVVGNITWVLHAVRYARRPKLAVVIPLGLKRSK